MYSSIRDSARRPSLEYAPEGRYANYFEVSHSACEFIVDFGQFHPEQVAAQLHIRVVTGPVYAKLLSRMLSEAIERHERVHGVIETDPAGLAVALDANGDCSRCERTAGAKRRT